VKTTVMSTEEDQPMSREVSKNPANIREMTSETDGF